MTLTEIQAQMKPVESTNIGSVNGVGNTVGSDVLVARNVRLNFTETRFIAVLGGATQHDNWGPGIAPTTGNYAALTAGAVTASVLLPLRTVPSRWTSIASSTGPESWSSVPLAWSISAGSTSISSVPALARA